MRQAAAYSATKRKVHLDIVELFGGEGGITKIDIRLSLRGGINFDIITGFDLMNKADVTFLWAYLSRQKPKCVAMFQPCTAFCKWSQRNRVHAASTLTWLRSRVAGMRLSRLCALVARFQMEHGRLFAVENPHGSEMGRLPFWKSILDMQGIYAVKVQMCAAGLRDPLDPKYFIQKDTWIVANHKDILEPLTGLQCPGVSADHQHLHNEQGRRSKLTQVWPRKFCEKLARGILKAISQANFYPTQEEYSNAKCTACRWRKRTDDPTHARVRGECLHLDIASGEVSVWQKPFSCPACKKRAMRYDPEHTYKDGECWRSEHEIALRTRRALPVDVVPSAAPRVEEPPVPLLQRGSPRSPEDEGGQQDVTPPEPPREDPTHGLHTARPRRR